LILEGDSPLESLMYNVITRLSKYIARKPTKRYILSTHDSQLQKLQQINIKIIWSSSYPSLQFL